MGGGGCGFDELLCLDDGRVTGYGGSCVDKGGRDDGGGRVGGPGRLACARGCDASPLRDCGGVTGYGGPSDDPGGGTVGGRGCPERGRA